MDRSLLTKMVWLGAIAAIPVSVLCLQKPHVTVAPETRRVITMDRPVAVDIKEGEVEGPKPLDPTKPLESTKTKTMWVGGGRITSKAGAASQADVALAPGKLPAKDPSSLTASVTPPAGSRAQ